MNTDRASTYHSGNIPSAKFTRPTLRRSSPRLQRESATSPFVFVSERGSPFTTAGFARMIERAAAAAGLELKAHPHMLRHACGYALANKGHDTRAIQGWLGHRSITTRRSTRRWRRTGLRTSGGSDRSTVPTSGLPEFGKGLGAATADSGRSDNVGRYSMSLYRGIIVWP
jgi:Phage integrase family